MQFHTRLWATAAWLVTISSATPAACPSSVKVGSPDNPVEIGPDLRGDAGFAAMHLQTVAKMLPMAQRSCQQGVAANCRMASFMAEAKAGLECYAGGSTSSSAGNANASQMNTGDARTMTGRPAAGGGQGSGFQSQEATACVEIVPKGFKCDGPSERFLTNICRTKITVHWRLGNDSWSQQDMPPAFCYPVSYYKDSRTVQYRACSWDPKASYGPLMEGCRY